MNPIDYARAYVAAISGDSSTPMYWRALHDKDKGAQPRVLHGSVDECWQTLCSFNYEGYGIFANINEMDGKGNSISNIDHIRTHVVDLDDQNANENYQRSLQDGASFAVQSSPNKYHIYWLVDSYKDIETYSLLQRKFLQYYSGDDKVTDATRVMRVPGFYHMKDVPQLVVCWNITGNRYSLDSLLHFLSPVNVINHFSMRFALGDPEMSAPSLDWLVFAINMIDPNDLDYGEWVSLCAAIKQAGWLHAPEEKLKNIWLEFCERYTQNDVNESIKKWNSVKDTEVGWQSIQRRTPVNAYMQFGSVPPQLGAVAQRSEQGAHNALVEGSIPSSPTIPTSEILDAHECASYFKGCVWVQRMGEIFTPGMRFMNATKFNGTYGGKQFIITTNGKVTDEAWKAALRSTVYKIPSVDHVRFLPEKETGEMIEDDIGRKGLNIYVPIKARAKAGDVSPWLAHIQKLLPIESDRRIFFDYLAHCVKYPGYKIPWAPMIQSAEGTGKTIIREVLIHALGDMYVYQPKAPELIKSGSIFNAWMRAKLMIVVDEIKIDERRELIEILKPMISDARVEIQSKGVDQEMEDNVANWLFFSNYKDAIPINKNGRRYCIFYSAIQSASDIIKAGMGGNYFPNLFAWLQNEGYEAIAYWLLNYPIAKGAIPMRAPETSSYPEALALSRSPLEQLVFESVADGLPGFRGGFVSSLALAARSKSTGIRQPNAKTIQSCLEGMGYINIGRSVRPYMQEDLQNRADIYVLNSDLRIDDFARLQGYE